MAEEVLQRTITEAPQYLKPGIEKFLELSTAQAAQPMDTSQFATSDRDWETSSAIMPSFLSLQVLLLIVS